LPGDKSLLEECIEASRHLFYKKERKSLSEQGINSIKNVCHSATIPYKPSIPLHVLCELFTKALPHHIAPRFDACKCQLHLAYNNKFSHLYFKIIINYYCLFNFSCWRDSCWWNLNM